MYNEQSSELYINPVVWPMWNDYQFSAPPSYSSLPDEVSPTFSPLHVQYSNIAPEQQLSPRQLGEHKRSFSEYSDESTNGIEGPLVMLPLESPGAQFSPGRKRSKHFVDYSTAHFPYAASPAVSPTTNSPEIKLNRFSPSPLPPSPPQTETGRSNSIAGIPEFDGSSAIPQMLPRELRFRSFQAKDKNSTPITLVSEENEDPESPPSGPRPAKSIQESKRHHNEVERCYRIRLNNKIDALARTLFAGDGQEIDRKVSGRARPPKCLIISTAQERIEELQSHNSMLLTEVAALKNQMAVLHHRVSERRRDFMG